MIDKIKTKFLNVYTMYIFIFCSSSNIMIFDHDIAAVVHWPINTYKFTDKDDEIQTPIVNEYIFYR